MEQNGDNNDIQGLQGMPPQLDRNIQVMEQQQYQNWRLQNVQWPGSLSQKAWHWSKGFFAYMKDWEDPDSFVKRYE